MKKWIKKIKLFLVFSVSLFALFSGLIIRDGLTDELGTADVGLVFGNKVMPSGEPSARLAARLDRAVQLYNDGYFNKVIVSGGLGREGFYEADVMRDYLIERGIPDSNIIPDNQGNDTYMTVENTVTIMEENNIRSILVISQYFHIPRIKLACRRFGLEVVYSANAKYFGLRDLYQISREVIAYGYYLVRSYP
ncbi:MAG: YdcF family protein [Anaerolineales bacterium]|nr:YdcF family protein [Anaerolineales bacterium]